MYYTYDVNEAGVEVLIGMVGGLFLDIYFKTLWSDCIWSVTTWTRNRTHVTKYTHLLFLGTLG